ncbi:MAG: hypothetical protein IKV77_04670 [Alistipes sp.]|nr:hypothetical protein [Flavobacteriales bacterium]MBR5492410.1 hypothetical protein [Alistipes sp.]
MTQTERQKTQEEAVAALIEKGVTYSVKRKGVLRYLFPDFKIKIEPPTLGVLYSISSCFAAMEIDEEKVEESPLTYGFALVEENAHNLSRAIAYAILADKFLIKSIGGLVSRYIMWQFTPRDMFMIVVNILTMCGTADFINSIRLIKGVCLAEAKNRIE